MEYDKLKEKFINYCIYQRELSDKTIRAYIIDLKQFEKFIGEERQWSNKEKIISYIEYLNKNYKPKSSKRKTATLKVFLNYLENEGELKANPFNKIRLKYKEAITLPKTIELSEIEKILAYAHRETKDCGNDYQYKVAVRNAVFLELLFATGARVSEICSLKLKDVHIKEQYIKIYGKGSKERIIGITNEQVIDVMEKYFKIVSEQRKSDDYYFINRLGNRYSEQSARNMITKYVKACGIEKHITPHMFRHSFATCLLDNDVDIRFIQHLLGHSSIATTQIYTHISRNKEKDILSHKHPRNKFRI